MRVSQIMPPADIAGPMISGTRMPILPTSWDVTPAATMMPTVIGKNPTPVLTAEYPSMFCRKRVRK